MECNGVGGHEVLDRTFSDVRVFLERAGEIAVGEYAGEFPFFGGDDAGTASGIAHGG